MPVGGSNVACRWQTANEEYQEHVTSKKHLQRVAGGKGGGKGSGKGKGWGVAKQPEYEFTDPGGRRLPLGCLGRGCCAGCCAGRLPWPLPPHRPLPLHRRLSFLCACAWCVCRGGEAAWQSA